MDPHASLRALQKYNVTARCGQETSVDKGTKLTWSGLQSTFDGYSPTVVRVNPVDLGVFVLQPGERNVSLMIIGRNPQSTGFLVGVDRIDLKPDKAVSR